MGSGRRRNGRLLAPPAGGACQRQRAFAPPILTVSVVLVVFSAFLLGCGRTASQAGGPVSPSLNPPGVSCSGLARIPTRPASVPLRIERSGAGVRVLVPMCVDGRGPFPFVLDTGATSTLFDTHFLDDVRFPQNAPVELLHQPGCATVVLHVVVNRWSMGPVELAAQSAAVVRMPGFGLSGQPVGLLGSDVLSRFGALRIDYRTQLLTVAGPEGPTSVEGTTIDGPTSVPVAPGLVGVGARAAVPLDVTTSASGTSVLTPVMFGAQGPFPFAVATGAESSALTALLAANLGLTKTGQSQDVTSFGCIDTAPAVRSGPWAIGSVALPPQQMATAVAASSASDSDGLVGSDALSSYGSVVLDYRSGSLFLGAGPSAA